LSNYDFKMPRLRGDASLATIWQRRCVSLACIIHEV
jgi:hypothetical protein